MITILLPAPAKQVYTALTNQDWLTCWLSDGARTLPKENGYILLTWYDGRFLQGNFGPLAENESLAYQLGQQSAGFSLKAQGEQTELSVEAEDEAFWEKPLSNLLSVLATGADERLTKRIILGIFPETLTEEQAQEIGIKPSQGLGLSGLVPNSGAEKAGLKGGDVILAINGKALAEGQTLGNLLESAAVGDVVEVEYYRGGERQSVSMPLMGYPLPPFFGSYPEVVAHWGKLYRDLYAEFEAIFEGVSAEQAARQPAEGEWSANEVLGHLILHERWLHTFMGGWMQDEFLWTYTCNTPARIAGITKTYADHHALLAELKRCGEESMAILGHIPAEFLPKHTMRWWFQFELDASLAHARQHQSQIQAALAH